MSHLQPHQFLPPGVTIVHSDENEIWTWVIGTSGVRIFSVCEDGTFENEGFEMDNPPTHINEMLHYCRNQVMVRQIARDKEDEQEFA